MRKGFAFLPIMAIALAIAAIVGGTTALGALGEKPGSALYGAQRFAETLPTNLLSYAPGYNETLAEKRAIENATVFAQENSVSGAGENLITFFRLTTPENVSMGKDFILARGARVRVRGTDLVLELGAQGRGGRTMGYALVREGETVEYGGGNFTLLAGGDSPYGRTGNGTIVANSDFCAGGRCVSLAPLSLGVEYGWGLLKTSEENLDAAVGAHLVRGSEYLGTQTIVTPLKGGLVFFGKYHVQYSPASGAARMKVSFAAENRFYIKVCDYVDYSFNGTSCGAAGRKMTVELSSNGMYPDKIYKFGLDRSVGGGMERVCIDEGCAQNGRGIMLFSADGTDWAAKGSYVSEEKDYNELGMLVPRFDLDMRAPTRYLEMLLPDGRYGLSRSCCMNFESGSAPVLDTADVNASLKYELVSRGLLEGNTYIDVYGLNNATIGKVTYGNAIASISEISSAFRRITGRTLATQRIKISSTENPFQPYKGAAFYEGEAEGIAIPAKHLDAATVCHEMAHGLQYGSGRVDLGAPFTEGFAAYFCNYANYTAPRRMPATGFAECWEFYDEPHDLGECVFQNARERGLFSDAFFRKLIDFPCATRIPTDLMKTSGQNLWYYVLSTAAGKNVSDFPHTKDIDYCAPAADGSKNPDVRSIGINMPFALHEGEIVKISGLDAYVALGALEPGNLSSAEFLVSPGDAMEFLGDVVELRYVVHNNGYYLAGFALGNETWETISGAGPIPWRTGLGALNLTVLDVVPGGGGKFTARVRLDRMTGVSGMRLEYVAKTGITGLHLNASSGSALPGGYYLENTGADAAGRRATFVIGR